MHYECIYTYRANPSPDMYIYMCVYVCTYIDIYIHEYLCKI